MSDDTATLTRDDLEMLAHHLRPTVPERDGHTTARPGSDVVVSKASGQGRFSTRGR